MIDNKRPTQAEIEKVRELFRAQDNKRREFAEKYGEMRPPTVIKVGDKLLSIIEGVIYQQVREGTYNVMTVLHDHALIFFGEPYLEEEEKKQLEARHPAL